MKALDVLHKHPIKNKAWEFSVASGHFVTEDSDLVHRSDPWLRPFSHSLVPFTTNEEIGGWTTVTTVDGVTVKLVI